MEESVDILSQALIKKNILTADEAKKVDEGDPSDMPDLRPYDPLGHYICQDEEVATCKFLGEFWNPVRDQTKTIIKTESRFQAP